MTQQEIDREADAILKERKKLLCEVKEKEHSTQRSVYQLEGMVGKLVEIRDFTGAFFNKISYLDTKLPVSQRRLALWIDKLQALRSQWLRTVGRYVTVYAPIGVQNRFIEWEQGVQFEAMKARELRGEVGEIQLGGGGGSCVGPASSNSAGSMATSASRSIFSGSFTNGSLRMDSPGSLANGSSMLVGSHMVTSQSLKTEGNDSEKDARQTTVEGRDDSIIRGDDAYSSRT